MDYEERQAVRSRIVTVSLSTPSTLLDVLDRIADAEAVAFNSVVLRLLRKGLAVERDERAKKAEK